MSVCNVSTLNLLFFNSGSYLTCIGDVMACLFVVRSKGVTSTHTHNQFCKSAALLLVEKG